MRTLLPLALLIGCKSDNALIAEPNRAVSSDAPTPLNPVQADRTVQVVQPVVDILFVVDNSSSMGDEQLNLQTNFPLFIQHFTTAGIDYHIGMVSTNVQRPDHNGQLRVADGIRFIDQETEDPVATFAAMTSTLGVYIASEEAGRAAAYTALELLQDGTVNDGFIREEADLHVIFVTDDADYSQNAPVTQFEFMEWAANFKGDQTFQMHGIITPEEGCNSNSPSTDYLQYISLTGGVWYSICEPDWTPALDALGTLAIGLRSEFFLTRIPVRDPELLIQVQVRITDEEDNETLLDFVECVAGEEAEPGGEECEVLYVQGRNSIVFTEYTPPAQAEVLVTYGIAEDYSAGVPVEL